MDSLGGGGNPGPKCSSITVEEHAESFTTLIEMLPNVIQTLKGAGKMNLLIELYPIYVDFDLRRIKSQTSL